MRLACSPAWRAGCGLPRLVSGMSATPVGVQEEWPVGSRDCSPARRAGGVLPRHLAGWTGRTPAWRAGRVQHEIAGRGWFVK